MFVVVFVSLLLCSALILLFLLLRVLLYSSALVRSLFCLHTTPGFHWGADGRRKTLLGVFQRHASSQETSQGWKGGSGIKAEWVLKSHFLSTAVSCGLESWRRRAEAVGFKSTLRSSAPLTSVCSLSLLWRSHPPPSLPPSLLLSLYGSLCLLWHMDYWGFKKDMNYVTVYVQHVCVSEGDRGGLRS